MRFLITSIAITFFVFEFTFSQTPDTMWTRTFGGIHSDQGLSVEQCADGGYIIVGSTQRFDQNYDIYLVRTNETGSTIWTKVFSEHYTQTGYSVIQTIDGGYIITGIAANSGNSDVYLIKTDENGDTLWTKCYGGSNNGYGMSIRQTTDGGFIIVGYIRYYNSDSRDVWLLRTNSNGDTLWTKTFDKEGFEFGYSAEQTTDGGFIIGASTFPIGGSHRDLLLIRTDENGDTIWTKTFGGSNWEDGGYCQQTKEGGYILLGITDSFGGGITDLYLIKTNENGDTIWTRTYGGTGSDWGYSIQQTPDGGYIISGKTDSYGAGEFDVWVILTEENGDTVWTKTFGGDGNESGYSIQQTLDGGAIITGATNSYGMGSDDLWLIKLKPDSVESVEDIKTLSFRYNLSQNYPNPFNPSTKIKFTISDFGFTTLKVYDVLGKEVATLVNQEKPAGTYKVEWDASGFPSGVYFYQLKSANFVETKKMILFK